VAAFAALGLTVCAVPAQADIVRLTLGSGIERWLLWPSPRTAIWKGTSLVLNSTDGTVVVFPDLMSLLETKAPA